MALAVLLAIRWPALSAPVAQHPNWRREHGSRIRSCFHEPMLTEELGFSAQHPVPGSDLINDVIHEVQADFMKVELCGYHIINKYNPFA